MTLAHSIRAMLRRDVILICTVVFFADLVSGILSPTFSLYAKGLGASLTLIGILSSLAGMTTLLTAMPIGLYSDTVGRKRVLIFGLLAFAGATALYALAPNAWMLIPGRILVGMAGVASFSIGAAYMGDIIEPHERGIAFGLYATALGLGFAIGPLIGAAIASYSSVAVSYLGASVIGLMGAAIAAWGLRDTQSNQGGVKSQRVGLRWADMRLLARNPAILAGSLTNLMTSISFAGMIVNFFPVYMAQQGVGQAAINGMFSGRAFSSTAARLPSGILTSRVSSWLIFGLALSLILVVVMGMAQTVSVEVLGLLLLVEGVAYGACLTTGQAFVATHSTPTTRGAAIGMYSTAGSIGSTFSPLILGVLADLFGIRAVFHVTAVLSLLGVAAIVALYQMYQRQRQAM